MFWCALFLLFLISLASFFMLWIYFWTLLEWWPRLIWMFVVRWTIFWWWYLSFIAFEKVSEYFDKLEEKTTKKLDWITFIIMVVVLLLVIVIRGNHWDNRTCYNKTSIDYNRQNDMKCVNENWDVKRTDYEWARKLMWK